MTHDLEGTRDSLIGEAVERVRHVEMYLRRFQESARSMLYVMALPEGRYEYVSEEALDLYGYSPSEWYESPKLIAQVIHPDWQGYLEEEWRKLLSGDMPHSYEYQIIHKSGDARWLQQRNVLTRDGDGRPVAIEGIVTDITDRKEAEEGRRESEDRLRRVVGASPMGIHLYDLEAGDRLVFKGANPAADAILGVECAQFIGQTIEEAFPPLEATDVPEKYRRVAGEGHPWIWEQVSYDHGSISGAFEVYAFQTKPGSMASMFLDVTERKRVEESRKRLETAIGQAAEVVVITDAEGQIQYVNPAFEKLTGYTREEAVGQNPKILKSGRHDEAFYREMWETLKRGEVWSGRLFNKAKDGHLFQEEATISPIRDADGVIQSYVAVKRDVTREAELESRLRQAQKMEAIGTLAGGIAHDFNNLLQAMMGYLDLALADTPADSPAQGSLEEVAAAGSRAANLVDQILAFSRQSQPDLRPVRLQSVVKEALKLLRASLPSTVEIQEQVLLDPPPILADATELHQVVMNLCTNASQAMREQGGLLSVEVREVAVGGRESFEVPGLDPGAYVRLSVKDTGSGMDEETLARVFEPYFTTKKAGSGTGLGLATCLGIIEGSGGTITVQSESGKGTVFHAFFPVVPSLSTNEPEETRQAVLPAGNERLLFVDDEPAVAEIGRLGLERLGYQVQVHTDSLEALEAFSADPTGFDALITDQTMPRLTGLELAREVMRLRPGLPVILVTGFSESVDEATARKNGIQKFVMKPVLPRELAGAVREALD